MEGIRRRRGGRITIKLECSSFKTASHAEFIHCKICEQKQVTEQVIIHMQQSTFFNSMQTSFPESFCSNGTYNITVMTNMILSMMATTMMLLLLLFFFFVVVDDDDGCGCCGCCGGCGGSGGGNVDDDNKTIIAITP
jgi:hypothetical protein